MIVDFIRKAMIHTMAQRRQSTDPWPRGEYGPPLCRYRSGQGLRCLAGIFIPDKLYTRFMEDNTWDQLRKKFPEVDKLYTEEQHEVIARLQRIHDDPLNWGNGGEVALAYLISLANEKGICGEEVLASALVFG